METIYEAVIALVGEVPPGCEPLAYVLSGIVLIFLLQNAFGIVGSLLNWIGGK